MNHNSKYLGQIVEVIIDRPLGSKHPKYGFEYLLNYGYIENTISGDGEELDCYILCVENPIERFTGICIAIIHRIDDDDDKLIIVPDNKVNKITNSDIRNKTKFQEKFFKSIIIR
ncbi:inorganic pyrophosphatase [compost metagenome]